MSILNKTNLHIPLFTLTKLKRQFTNDTKSKSQKFKISNLNFELYVEKVLA